MRGAGGVAPLEQHDDALAALDEVLLQLHELDLELVERVRVFGPTQLALRLPLLLRLRHRRPPACGGPIIAGGPPAGDGRALSIVRRSVRMVSLDRGSARWSGRRRPPHYLDCPTPWRMVCRASKGYKEVGFLKNLTGI